MKRIAISNFRFPKTQSINISRFSTVPLQLVETFQKTNSIPFETISKLKTKDIATTLFLFRENNLKLKPSLIDAFGEQILKSSGNFDYDIVSFTLILHGSCIFPLQKRLMYLRILPELFSTLSYSDINPGNVTRVVYGIRELSSDYPEVAEILRFSKSLYHRCKIPFEPYQVSFAINSINSIGGNAPELLDLYKWLTSAVRNCQTPFTYANVCMALSGLKNLNSNQPESLKLASALSQHFRRFPPVPSPITSQNLATAMQGLRGFSNLVPDLEHNFQVIPSLLASFEGVLSPQEVAMCLSGLAHCSSYHPSGTQIVKNLIPLIQRSSGCFDPQLMSMAFHGLIRMDPAHPQVRSLLRSLHPLCEIMMPFSAQGVAMCLSGLKDMSCDYIEVREICESFSKLFKNATGTLTSQGYSMVFSGLKEQKSTHPEVRHLIHTITPLVAKYTGSLSIQGLSMCLSGLKGLDSELTEVQRLLATLLPVLKQSSGNLAPLSLRMVFQGFSLKSTQHIQVRQLLAEIPRFMSHIPSSTWQFISPCFSHMSGFDSKHEEVRAVLRAFVPIIQSIKEPLLASQLDCFQGVVQLDPKDGEEVQSFFSALAPHLSPLTPFFPPSNVTLTNKLKEIVEIK